MVWRERARQGFRRAKLGAQRALYFTFHVVDDEDAYEDSSDEDETENNDASYTLDDEIGRQRRMVWSFNKDDPERADVVDRLGRLLVERYEKGRDDLDINEALSCHGEALAARDPRDGSRARTLLNMSMAFKARYLYTRELRFLDSSITHLKDGLQVQTTPPDHSLYLSYLANTLWLRYEHSSRTEDLEESIKLHTEVLAARPTGNAARPVTLFNLSLALVSEYHERGALNSLEQAISYNQEAYSCLNGLEADLASSICDSLASSLGRRFRVTGNLSDIHEAISLYEQGLALCDDDHDGRATALGNLGLALEIRFSNAGDTADLERALVCFSESLSLRPPNHRKRWWSLLHYGGGLKDCYDHQGQLDDLDAAIDYLRQALDLVISTFPHIHDLKIRLSMALLSRYEARGTHGDLEEAARLQEDTLSAAPAQRAEHSSDLSNMALCLLARFAAGGDPNILEEGVEYCRVALDNDLPDAPGRRTTLGNLATALSTRFELKGRIEDLEEAGSHHRQALATLPIDHIQRPVFIVQLASYHILRYNYFTQMDDLEEAIVLLENAVVRYPSSHPDRHLALCNLTSALRTRYELLRNEHDLETALGHGRTALSLCTGKHPTRALVLNNLAHCALTRYNIHNAREDARDAINWWAEAVHLCPPGHSDRWMMLHNVSCALFEIFKRDKNVSDLEQAISFTKQALDVSLATTPPRALSLSLLAEERLARHDLLGSESDLDRSYDLLRDVTSMSSASATLRFASAQLWADSAHKHAHPTALAAYAQALKLVERCLIINPSIELQYKFLAQSPTALSLNAAACAVAAGQHEQAVEMLEQGRSLLWRRLRGYRQPVKALRLIDPTLADEFELASKELESLAIVLDEPTTIIESQAPALGGTSTKLLASKEARWTRQRVLSSQWDELLTRIRQLEGMHDFLRALSYRSLRESASEGPVIVVNLSTYRSDALVMLRNRESRTALIPIKLSNSLHKVASGSAQRLQSDHGDDGYVTRCLSMLWRYIGAPVVAELDKAQIPRGSRIWWCPTSALSALPLHAAQALPTDVDASTRLSDCFVSSYTTTISSLITARANLRTFSMRKLLVVATPDAFPPLPEVKRELAAVTSLGSFVTALSGTAATPDAVIETLPSCDLVHFACHAHVSATSPLDSHFALHAGAPLRVIDVLQARVSAQLAVLSACSTAVSSPDGTPDEALHPAAALQFSGLPSVIGTLWTMKDADGPEFTSAFYKHLLGEEDGGVLDVRKSVWALKAAIGTLQITEESTARESERAVFKGPSPREGRVIRGVGRWATFAHFGA